MILGPLLSLRRAQFPLVLGPLLSRFVHGMDMLDERVDDLSVSESVAERPERSEGRKQVGCGEDGLMGGG